MYLNAKLDLGEPNNEQLCVIPTISRIAQEIKERKEEKRSLDINYIILLRNLSLTR